MRHLNQILVLLTGALIGTASSPWTLPFVSELTGKADSRNGYRVPELKIDLSSDKGTSEIMIWKSVIPAATNNTAGLAMHRHNYARTLIPMTEGVLQRRDADGKTTDYVLTPGKPLLLPADTPQGFHTDENFGKKPIEVVVVQFNQSSPVKYSALTEEDIKSSFGKAKP
ncbi:MAG: hypothetical protein ACHQAX_09920 [Gammaproteobacteria bacterium]